MELKRWIDRLVRLTVGLAWSGIVGAIVLMLWADVLPARLEHNGPIYLLLSCVAFVVQNFLIHIGIACAMALGAALCLRRWKLAVLAMFAVVLAALPIVWLYRPIRRTAQGKPVLRVMAMNVLWDNHHPERALAQVRDVKPDVLVMVEYSQQEDQAIRAGLSEFPYRVIVTRRCDGWAIFSKRPIRQSDSALTLYDWPRGARAVIDVDGRDVTLYGMHLVCPASVHAVGEQREEIAALSRAIARENNPVIVAGDLNSTEMTSNLAALRNLGLCTAHQLAGHGFGWTWPTWGLTRCIPAFRIDHVFISKQLTCTRSDTVGGTGSDHRAIVADLAWAAGG